MKSNVFLIYGDDDFNAETRAGEIVNALIAPEQHSLGLVAIDGAATNSAEAARILQRVQDELLTLGFLGKKVVWLRGANFLGADAASKSAAVQDQLTALISALSSGLPSDHALVVTAQSVDARSRFFNACRKNGEVIHFEAQTSSWQRGNDAARRAAEAFSKRGLLLERDVLKAFVEKVGFDSRRIEQEAEKLSVFMGDRRNVVDDDIEAIVSASGEAIVWDLQDRLGNRNLAGSLAVLRQLIFQGENPIGLIICIENRFRHLSVFREALDNRWLTASHSQGNRVSPPAMGRVPDHIKPMVESALQTSKGRMSPYSQAKLAAQAGNFTAGELDRCRRMIMETYRKLVSSSAPREILLELLVAKLCRINRT